MTNKIYIAVAYGGQYEDAWESNGIASFDLAKIEEHVKIKEHYFAMQKVWVEKILAFDREYREKFATPAYVSDRHVPKWPAGIDQRLISKEAREERNEVLEHNKRTRSAWSARSEALVHWQARSFAARNEYLISQGMTSDNTLLEKDFSFSDYNVSYRIDEVDLI